MSKVFRLKSAVKYYGMIGTAVFALALLGVGASYLVATPVSAGSAQQLGAAGAIVFLILVFGATWLLSVYLWVSYYVEHVTIAGSTLTVRSITQGRRFMAAEIERLVWRYRPHNSTVRVQSRDRKATIALHGYCEPDQLELIRWLRKSVEFDRQEGWPLFCHEVALRLRDGTSPLIRELPASDLIQITRGRYDRVFRIIGPLSIFISLALAAILRLPGLIAVPFFTILLWLCLRFAIPVHGSIEPRIRVVHAPPFGWIGIGGLVLSFAAFFVLTALGVREGLLTNSAIALLLLSIVSLVYGFHLADGRRKTTQELAALSAPEMWERGEVGVASALP